MWSGALVYMHFTSLLYAWNKYVFHTAHICTGYISQKEETATFIYHVIATYVPATNVPLKCHIHTICVNYSTCIRWGNDANVYATYELSGLIMLPHRQCQMTIQDVDNAFRLNKLSWPLAKSAKSTHLSSKAYTYLIIQVSI